MITLKDQIYSRDLKLMGNLFGFTVVAEHEAWAKSCIDDAILEIQRIEKLLTTYSETSQTHYININAGIRPVDVDREVFDLIERSLRISALTQGAFDITYGSIDKSLWNFDTSMTSLPDVATAKSMVRLINFRNVILDKKNQTVYLKEKGMRIGFGGIGKGYAADRAKEVMRKSGVANGIVNAAGDLTVWGRQPSGEAWTIGIADPDKKDSPLASIQLTDTSVATSGNYEKYIMIDGVKYSHTIDPKSGYPVRGIKSVTIICASGEIADAMATPVMVMGIKPGLTLINQLKDIACIIIDDNNTVYTSKNINLT
ncbi:FAD:protein FMN transferase [Ohtaekwangia koreensis]|uniref:FAD:protein FMN transferase n=1 Tax=Ohtaekwangia koreensis TaxID=688867 RepID=A0A1T5LPF7_9BACT|nr:FAD:protein FMN transferase [Ohtaekwangia koreensis]SKC77439.1 thiamine biosynthesis lipoprotein [Ohtaekwangia koreensis]